MLTFFILYIFNLHLKKKKSFFCIHFWHIFSCFGLSGTSSRRVWRALTLTGITASPSWTTTICSWPVFWWWFCPSSSTCSVWDAYTTAPHSCVVPLLPSSGWRRAWVHQTSLLLYRPWTLSIKQLANHWRRHTSSMIWFENTLSWFCILSSLSPTIIMSASRWPVLHFHTIICKGFYMTCRAKASQALV